MFVVAFFWWRTCSGGSLLFVVGNLALEFVVVVFVV